MKKCIAAIIVIAVASILLSAYKPKEQEVPQPEPTMEAIDRLSYWAKHPDESPLNELNEILWLATVADAVAPDGDDRCKTAVMQCVLNRTQAVGFPDTVEGVATQPNQWQGLARDSQPSTETKNLARTVLEAYRTGTVLEIPRNCVFMVKTDTGLVFRAEWESTETVEVLYGQ